jgi:hypothetical protein
MASMGMGMGRTLGSCSMALHTTWCVLWSDFHHPTCRARHKHRHKHSAAIVSGTHKHKRSSAAIVSGAHERR